MPYTLERGELISHRRAAFIAFRSVSIQRGKNVMSNKNEISRRSFLENLILGTAGVGIACGMQPQDGILAMNDGRKLGVALLGLGRYATGQLGPALRETKNCKLTAVITGTPAKGE